jgi:hypothetical protein
MTYINHSLQHSCPYSTGVRARLQSVSSADRVDSRGRLVSVINENPGKCLGMIIRQALFPLDESRNDTK